MKIDTVKPTPASAATPTTLGQPTPSGSVPIRRRTAEPRERGDADELADDEADDDTPRDARRERVADDVGVEEHARVGQREQRNDDEARPRVQHLFEPLHGRHRLAREVHRFPSRLDGRDVGEFVGVDHFALVGSAASAP